MSSYSRSLVLGTLLTLAITSSVLAQSTPSARITNDNGPWGGSPTATTERATWSSQNFGTTPVVTSINLVSTSTNPGMVNLWNSGLTPGNYREGNKTFTVTTTAYEASIYLNGALKATVPVGYYRLSVDVRDQALNPNLLATNYSAGFQIEPNVTCPVTVRVASGSGTAYANTSPIPSGQTTNIFYDPATGYQASSARYQVGSGSWTDVTLNATGGHFTSPACTASGNVGQTITAEVNFTSAGGCPLNITKSPTNGGTVSITNLFNGKIPAGQSSNVTATPNAGYTFSSFVGANSVSGNVATVSCPAGSTATKNLTVNFTLDKCPFTYTTPTNGTLSPASGTMLNRNTLTSAVTARANSGYVINTLNIGGTNYSPQASGQATYAPTTTPATILCPATPVPVTASVTFRSAGECTITHPTEIPGGSIAPTTGTTIPFGGTQSVTARSQAAHVYKYIVDTFTVNDNVISVPANSSSVSQPVTCLPSGINIPVNATFKSTACKLTTRVIGTGGRISPEPNTLVSVLAGTTGLKVTATPNTGYKIKTFTVPGDTRPVPATGPMEKKVLCATAGTDVVATVEFEPANSCTFTATATPTNGGTVTLTPTNGIVQPNQRGIFNVRSTIPGWTIKSFKYRLAGGAWQDSRVAPNTTTLSKAVTCPATGGLVEGVGEFEQKVDWLVTTSIESDPSDPNAGKIEPMPLGKKLYTTSAPAEFTVTPSEGYVVEAVELDGREIQPNASGKYVVNYDASKKDRELIAYFLLACFSYPPEQTISDLRAGRPAQINEESFEDWVSTNEELIKKEMGRGQCEYAGNFKDLYYTDGHPDLNKALSSLIKALNVIRPPLRVDRPGLFGVALLGVGAHSLIALDLQEIPSSVPGWVGAKKYILNYIDSNKANLDGEDYVTCQEKLVPNPRPGLVPYIRGVECDFEQQYGTSTVGVFMAQKTDMSFNQWVSNMTPVRLDSVEWLRKNYTEIQNFGVPESPGGVCRGWGEFNIRAALLVKECPWKGDPTARADSDRLASMGAGKNEHGGAEDSQNTNLSIWQRVGVSLKSQLANASQALGSLISKINIF